VIDTDPNLKFRIRIRILTESHSENFYSFAIEKVNEHKNLEESESGFQNI